MEIMPGAVRSLVVLFAFLNFHVGPGEGFVPRVLPTRAPCCLWGVKEEALGALSDAAKGLAKQATDKINELTGKDDYEFGDLAKLLDEKARAAVADMTDKEEADFGDLVKLAESKVEEVKGKVASSEELAKVKEFGESMVGPDLKGRLEELMGGEVGADQPVDFQGITERATKEIVSLIQSRKYGVGDLFFLLKLCTSFGLGMNPAVMSLFPLNVLIQLYNLSLIQEAGQGVATAVALELDNRARSALALKLEEEAKMALFGDENVEVGALFKKAITDSLGANDYNFGDITSNLIAKLSDDPSNIKPIGVAEEGGDPEVLDAELVTDLEAIDRALNEVVVDVEVVEQEEEQDETAEEAAQVGEEV